MKFIGFLLILILLINGCSEGKSEQFRITVYGYNVFAGNSEKCLFATKYLQESPDNSSRIIGSWTLSSFTGNFGQAIGSNMTFNANGTMVVMTYTISGNTLNLNGKNVPFNLVYIRS
jgi:hypothetical protein